jgi:hypothetical protein
MSTEDKLRMFYFITGLKEWTGESKGRSVHEFLTQIEILAKVSGWSSHDKAFIVKAKLKELALQFLEWKERTRPR